MANEKSLVEEAIIQMKNLEEAVAENAKGILASTMSQEIKELVKESLTEQEDEIETEIDVEDTDDSDDITDIEMDDESEDEEEDDTDMDNMDMDFGDDEMDDEEDIIDLTDADDEEVLRVFQLMGPDDNIVVTKDESGNTHLKDEETGKEYMIVGEGEEEFTDMDMEIDEDNMDMEMDEEEMEMDEDDMDGESIESIVERMFGSDDDEEMDMDMEFDDDEDMDFDEEDMDMDFDEEDMDMDFDEEEMDEEIVYEIEMDDDEDEEEMEDEEENNESLYESKSTIKPKGTGMGNASKFKYDKSPNLGTGFSTKMKEGDKTMGTGKPKFTYKDGENAGSKLGKNKMVKKTETKESDYGMNKGDKSKTMKGDKDFTTKKGDTLKKKAFEKEETKEASRTLGSGSNFRKGGLPKPRAHSQFNTNIKENTSNKELEVLREKNEEYRKALNIFRNKLNEVAVFNSNLAYATRLFTEHSTSKQEKINILRRFDSVETIKESKNLYQTIKNELSEVGTKTQTMNESLERKIAKVPSTGSAVNLIESKTYENPQFLRMKDLMAKIK